MSWFRKIKVDPNDVLFSKIVRFGKDRCDRCDLFRKLQCAHIFGRRYKAIRFERRNAVALCSNCHAWFDSHKIDALIWDEKKRVLTGREEGFTWLVKARDYTWDELARLYAKGQSGMQNYAFKKIGINEQLTKKLKELTK
jgi:hypothetical protein